MGNVCEDPKNKLEILRWPVYDTNSNFLATTWLEQLDRFSEEPTAIELDGPDSSKIQYLDPKKEDKDCANAGNIP